MILKQPSKLLTKYNIPHAIGGSVVNFKQSQGEEVYRQSINLLLSESGISPMQLYHGEQVHGKNVEIVGDTKQEQLFAGFPIYHQTDGFLTNREGTALLIRMADCTPIVIYDVGKHVLGVVHSGWRGTVQKISIVALNKMQQLFGTKVEDVVIYVGPSIDQAHYEVGKEVYEAFEEIGNQSAYFKPQGEKYLLDMVQANIEVLKTAGIQTHQIEFSTESTYTSERLHSARGEGVNYQLNGLVVQLPNRNK